ncbi:FecR domain-containing protein [Neorhizobium sp. NCHU2750]|uniref:FecR family protein n=1 Tax=Neorhizobium sp. NCHU2750 TaxID=1825976 RepID=UPI000E73A71E|nr:transmembrane sensor [Neorhizobium sp. NCHU2750]
MSDKPTEEQRDEAALWLAKRTGGSLREQEAERFDAWLNEDLRHRRAFDELRVLYAQLEAPAARLAARTPFRRKVAVWLRPRWSWTIPPASGVAILCCLWWLNPTVIQNWQADVVTDRNVVSVVALPDGSSARLGADTAIALDFSAGRRQVRLLRGEAYFEVRHGADGIFTVLVDGDRIRDIGTKFNVEHEDDKTEVTVSEGAVEVMGTHDATAMTLFQGDQVAIAAGRTAGIRKADPELVLSWLTGRLVVEGARIDDVVRALQRHTTSRIVVRGSLADHQISGTFPLTDVDASLATIASAVNGSITRVTPLLTILH